MYVCMYIRTVCICAPEGLQSACMHVYTYVLCVYYSEMHEHVRLHVHTCMCVLACSSRALFSLGVSVSVSPKNVQEDPPFN